MHKTRKQRKRQRRKHLRIKVSIYRECWDCKRCQDCSGPCEGTDYDILFKKHFRKIQAQGVYCAKGWVELV